MHYWVLAKYQELVLIKKESFMIVWLSDMFEKICSFLSPISRPLMEGQAKKTGQKRRKTPAISGVRLTVDFVKMKIAK